jgi:hypothetical protein
VAVAVVAVAAVAVAAVAVAARPNLSCPPKPAQIGWTCCKLPCCRGRDCRESPRLKPYIPYRLHRRLNTGAWLPFRGANVPRRRRRRRRRRPRPAAAPTASFPRKSYWAFGASGGMPGEGGGNPLNLLGSVGP